MSKKFINQVHIEGRLYEQKLNMKVTGPDSKNPGTQFIQGDISIATDEALTNIVTIHYQYVAEKYPKSGKSNANFPILSQILNGELKSVMTDGAENAAKMRIDSEIGLNDFYSDRNGSVELVSTKRNNGGFIHVTSSLNEDESKRNLFCEDFLITGVRRMEADEERNLPEKVIVKGAIFSDYTKSILPVEFSALNPRAMDYFESLGASSSNPVFTQVKGKEVSETIVNKIVEESAFGEPSVRETPSSRRDYVITWAKSEPYVWDDEGSVTAAEVKEMLSNREIALANEKQRWMDYRNNGSSSQKTAKTAAKGEFDF